MLYLNIKRAPRFILIRAFLSSYGWPILIALLTCQVMVTYDVLGIISGNMLKDLSGLQLTSIELALLLTSLIVAYHVIHPLPCASHSQRTKIYDMALKNYDLFSDVFDLVNRQHGVLLLWQLEVIEFILTSKNSAVAARPIGVYHDLYQSIVLTGNVENAPATNEEQSYWRRLLAKANRGKERSRRHLKAALVFLTLAFATCG